MQWRLLKQSIQKSKAIVYLGFSIRAATMVATAMITGGLLFNAHEMNAKPGGKQPLMHNRSHSL